MRRLYLGSNINLSGTCSLLVRGSFHLSLTWSARNHPLKRDSLLHCWLYRADFKQNAHPGILGIVIARIGLWKAYRRTGSSPQIFPKSSTHKHKVYYHLQNTLVLVITFGEFYECIDNRCRW